MLLTSSDAKRTLMHLFLFTNSAQRTGFNMYAEYTYATAINFPCIRTLITHSFSKTKFYWVIYFKLAYQWIHKRTTQAEMRIYLTEQIVQSSQVGYKNI